MTSQKLNQRQARWVLYLSQFDFILKYIPEKSIEKINGLSRRLDWQKYYEYLGHNNFYFFNPLSFTFLFFNQIIGESHDLSQLSYSCNKLITRSVILCKSHIKEYSSRLHQIISRLGLVAQTMYKRYKQQPKSKRNSIKFSLFSPNKEQLSSRISLTQQLHYTRTGLSFCDSLSQGPTTLTFSLLLTSGHCDCQSLPQLGPKLKETWQSVRNCW